MAESMLAPDNPYGYQLNVNHPEIQPLYFRFKAWKGLARGTPLSDAERFEFEKYILDRNPRLRQELEERKAGRRSDG